MQCVNKEQLQDQHKRKQGYYSHKQSKPRKSEKQAQSKTLYKEMIWKKKLI